MYLLPSPSFRRRPACMDAGGRAMSGTKAEESSGLLHTFPPGGNDHTWVIPASITSAIRLTSRPVSLDSGLRRNDDWAASTLQRTLNESWFSPISEITFLVAMVRGMTGRYPLPWPSFRRRPESSGLWNTFPPSGNDHAWVIPASAICLTLRPVFLGPFQTRLYYGSAELAERSASMQAWIPACVGMTTGRKQRLKDPESIAGLYLIFNDWHRSRYLAQTARAGLPGACSGRQ